MFTDFQLGINTAGIHFMCRNTGAIFTVNKISADSTSVSVCSTSAKPDVLRQLQDYISKNLKNVCFTNYEDISRCYIAPYLDFIVIFIDSQIALKHKQTGKTIYLSNGTSYGKVQVALAHEEPLQNYDKVLIDFKNVFWKDVDFFGVWLLSKKDTLIEFPTRCPSQITSEIFFIKVTAIQTKKVLEKGAEIKAVSPIFYGMEPRAIKVSVDGTVMLEVCNFGLYWKITHTHAYLLGQPVCTAIYLINIIKKFCFIKRVVFYCKTIDGTPLEFEINKSNSEDFLVELEKNYPVNPKI